MLAHPLALIPFENIFSFSDRVTILSELFITEISVGRDIKTRTVSARRTEVLSALNIPRAMNTKNATANMRENFLPKRYSKQRFP